MFIYIIIYILLYNGKSTENVQTLGYSERTSLRGDGNICGFNTYRTLNYHSTPRYGRLHFLEQVATCQRRSYCIKCATCRV